MFASPSPQKKKKKKTLVKRNGIVVNEDEILPGPGSYDPVLVQPRPKTASLSLCPREIPMAKNALDWDPYARIIRNSQNPQLSEQLPAAAKVKPRKFVDKFRSVGIGSTSRDESLLEWHPLREAVKEQKKLSKFPGPGDYGIGVLQTQTVEDKIMRADFGVTKLGNRAPPLEKYANTGKAVKKQEATMVPAGARNMEVSLGFDAKRMHDGHDDTDHDLAALSADICTGSIPINEMWVRLRWGVKTIQDDLGINIRAKMPVSVPIQDDTKKFFSINTSIGEYSAFVSLSFEGIKSVHDISFIEWHFENTGPVFGFHNGASLAELEEAGDRGYRWDRLMCIDYCHIADRSMTPIVSGFTEIEVHLRINSTISATFRGKGKVDTFGSSTEIVSETSKRKIRLLLHSSSTLRLAGFCIEFPGVTENVRSIPQIRKTRRQSSKDYQLMMKNHNLN